MTTPDHRARAPRSGSGLGAALAPVAVLAAVPLGLFHLAVLTAGALTGGAPEITFGDTARAVWHSPGDPLTGYPGTAGALPPAVLTFVLFGLYVFVLMMLLAVAWWLWARRGRHRDGTATSHELARTLGADAARDRAARDRPSLAGKRRPDLREAAVFLGHDAGTGAPLWGSHEDSMYVVGPPRSGKTISVCIPLVLDAPGAVVASSTKADLLTAAGVTRRRRGDVLVFDPENLAHWPDRLRWSPTQGCADPAAAIRRADALVAAKPLAGATNTGFFTEAAGTVLRCLLHAAALDNRTMRDVMRWSADFADHEPLDILRGHPGAARDWAEHLRTYTQGGAEETVGSLKMTLSLVLKALADPNVLDMCSPRPEEAFDAAAFVRSTGSLFLLNSGDVSGSTAPLVTALVDDIAQTAKRLSQAMPGGRLDPPLRLVLDEAATGCPLPGLPTYMADSGGRGITTCVSVQTFAQARARWGRDEAGQIFGAATVKLVLGGIPEADDLEALSRLCGERDVATRQSSHGYRGDVTVSHATRRERVLTPSEIRQLPPGRGLLLYRTMSPTVVGLQRWLDRPDARTINADVEEARRMIQGLTP